MTPDEIKKAIKDNKCSFCKKPLSAVGCFIAGSDVNICDQCITTCHDILVGNPGPHCTAEWLDLVQNEIKILTDQAYHQFCPEPAATIQDNGQ